MFIKLSKTEKHTQVCAVCKKEKRFYGKEVEKDETVSRLYDKRGGTLLFYKKIKGIWGFVCMDCEYEKLLWKK